MNVEDFEKIIWKSDYRAEFVYVKMDLKIDSAVFYFYRRQFQELEKIEREGLACFYFGTLHFWHQFSH